MTASPVGSCVWTRPKALCPSHHLRYTPETESKVMWMKSLPYCAIAASILTSSVLAQAGDQAAAPSFAPPVQMQATSKPLAVGRQAGPHLADFDGDGTADMLLGDVMGWVFIAKGLGDGSTSAFADPVRVLMADRAALKFHNW